jgi:uncharacterized protein (DUF2062 family)
MKAFLRRVRRLMPARDETRPHRALRWLGPLLEREWLWHMNRRAVASGVAPGVFFGMARFMTTAAPSPVLRK